MARLASVAPLAIVGAFALALPGCADVGKEAPAPEQAASATTRDVPGPAIGSADATELIAGTGPVEVHRSATCGCCGDHATYLTDAGFEVEEHVHERSAEVTDFKSASGIPEELWSCHTTIVDGYAVEGHVPTDVIVTLLAERPAVAGIALPGMPAGSPGMGGEKDGLWTFFAFDGDDAVEVFSTR
jgi:hypothetical protein